MLRASAIHSSEILAAEAELLNLEGRFSATGLVNVHNFFDGVDISSLCQEL